MEKSYKYYWVDCGINGKTPIYIGDIKKKRNYDHRLNSLKILYKTKSFSNTIKFLTLKIAKDKVKDFKIYALKENDFLETIKLIEKEMSEKYHENISKIVRYIIIKAYKSDILSKPPIERYLIQ